MNVHDPVCGKEMDLGDAVAFEDHEGWGYFFCSLDCHEVFKTSPERFTKMPGTAAGSSSTSSTASSRRDTCENH
jgi:YHS domain-containing protein